MDGAVGCGLLKQGKVLLMFFKPAISAQQLSKSYHLYNQPSDRLKQFLWRGRRQFFQEFKAIQNINLEVMPGEVLGIIGRNGAGKSTLLQLICGTLTPSSGQIEVNGRIAALLELGAGFNPEFSGRENVWMNATILGLSDKEISDRYEEIVEFSGIGDFIEQPVKTYSSGMYVRLAFAVATSVDPDILIVDEALSVGDGAFARKSFDRIMALKEAGKTILFCSHSLYQIEALCDHAIWLDKGNVRMQGAVEPVIMTYQNELLDTHESSKTKDKHPTTVIKDDVTKLLSVTVNCNNISGKVVPIRSLQDSVSITAEFIASMNLPSPNIAVAITTLDNRGITMAHTQSDEVILKRNEKGLGRVKVIFENIPLGRGEYWIDVYLGCENSIYIYDVALQVAKLQVTQEGIEQGIVKLPHYWVSD